MKKQFLILLLMPLLLGGCLVEEKETAGSISSFTDCLKAGGPVMESYPRQCRAGSITFTEDIGNELAKLDLIRLDFPRPNMEIASPLQITGQARGNWFFEADFPVMLEDQNGSVIAQGTASALSDWMTEDFVAFTVELSFNDQVSGSRGLLILKKDNPSGLPEYDDALEVPVYFK